MRGYGQYCPIARGAEVFATRWTPIIVRNLLLGCRTYGELRDGAAGIPRSLLSERLRQLEAHGLVRRLPNPRGRGWLYEPTDACRELRPVCDALGAWGSAWVEMTPEHTDPYTTLWGLCRGLRAIELPPERVTVRFEIPDAPRGQTRFWVLVQRPEPEVCVKPPGYDEDLVVTAEAGWLARWLLGEVSLGQGLHAGRVAADGPADLVHALAGWGEASSAALGRWAVGSGSWT